METDRAHDGRRDLRTAVIGYGLGGRAFHAPFVAAGEGLRLTAVVTGNAERRAEIGERYPDTEVIASADEVFDRAGEFDLAVVTTPNGTHVDLARRALAAGLHTVVDKPIAGTAVLGRDLFEQAGKAGLVLQAFQNRRWDGDFRTLRRLLADGALGDVRRFESRFERWRPDVGTGWKSWKEDADPSALGGILYDLGSHLVDQAVALFGRPERVYAEVAVRRPGARVDDDAFVALTHRGGTVSHLWMSAAAPQLGPRLRVLGSTNAYLKYGLDVQEAALKEGAVPGGPGWGEEPEESWGGVGNADDGFRKVRTEPGDYQEFYQGVRRAVLGLGSAPVPPEETGAVLEVLDAARVSAGEGRVVEM